MSDDDYAQLARELEQKATIQSGSKQAAEFERLREPALLTSREIFNVFDEALTLWCSQKRHVIVVSPFFDTSAVDYLARLLEKSRTKLTIYTRENQKKNNSKDTFSVKEIATKAKLKCTLKTLENFDYQKHQDSYFHAKFLAGVDEEQKTVSLLLTSANFTNSHLTGDDFFKPWSSKYCNHDTVSFHEMNADRFNEAFLNKMDTLCPSSTSL